MDQVGESAHGVLLRDGNREYRTYWEPPEVGGGRDDVLGRRAGTPLQQRLTLLLIPGPHSGLSDDRR